MTPGIITTRTSGIFEDLEARVLLTLSRSEIEGILPRIVVLLKQETSSLTILKCLCGCEKIIVEETFLLKEKK